MAKILNSGSPRAVVAVCTYNRAERLRPLVSALRDQRASAPFSILVVNNNSSDATAQVLGELYSQPGVPLRWVVESTQGIVPARNRAIAEALDADYLLFIDDDELPAPGWVEAAVSALRDEGADCVGGRIRVRFDPRPRPRWLGDDLLGFLGEVDNGPTPLWVQSTATPIWSGNVGYRLQLFRDDPGLRFDVRFNRAGAGIGGGSDARMFRELLHRQARLRYRPDMAIDHLVEPEKLRRGYFLRLHYRAGVKVGRFATDEYPRSLLGVPPFFVTLALRHLARTGTLMLRGDAAWLRQGMNLTHAVGTVWGRFLRWRERAA